MSASKPNLLLITADQLRYDCVGYSRMYPVRTPNLDRLAEGGIAFTHAYSHAPVCCPARQSLLHGRRPETFGALWNFGAFLPVGSLRPEHYAWPRTLAENGYVSAFLGKWGVHPELDATSFGYDSYLGEGEYKAFLKERYPDVRFAAGFFGEDNPVPVEDSGTHWLADRAIETIGRLAATGSPWHAAVHFAEPHLPCRPSGRFAAMYDPADVPEWAGFRDTFEGKPYIQKQQLYSWGVENFEWKDWAPVVARYYGMISQLDEAVGRIVAALEESGQADNTIVAFTADHGDLCGSHRMMDKHYVLYDDVVRVPLLLRLPGTRQGVRCDRFVYNLLDLPPTLLELLGLEAEAPANLQGRSLVPLLADGETASEWRDAVVAAYNGQQFGLYTQRMIRTERWKYVWNLTDTDELYDLEADPGELTNRIGEPEHAALVAELRVRLFELLERDEDPAVGNEWTRRQLLAGAKLAGRDAAAPGTA
ncbi:sulfatase-like hydrolase/transferase [Cohnella zeiphila]|uniref:Sulfatase-like hydrolase/transferase n=1 Tax=Cohnella zeiphila TaxID=2761120 RepID=A0A7X0VTP7_9BACL|nr:sulfatase-like hydrolase/transferase [Cohnella zeiphila]MBB6730176.1 sulfatase-like hydrolase/transferase [Cohnella zeiphila]